MPSTDLYIKTIIKRFNTHKELGEKAMLQLDDQTIHQRLNPEDNNVVIIVRHIHGNMLSRFTDFLESDGEKPWRDRDQEFLDNDNTVATLLKQWNEGWQVVNSAVEGLQDNDLNKTVTIRGEKHLVLDAILRQIAHYAYHVGQIVFIAKTIKGKDWQNLSIPKGQSEQFNACMQQQNK